MKKHGKKKERGCSVGSWPKLAMKNSSQKIIFFYVFYSLEGAKQHEVVVESREAFVLAKPCFGRIKKGKEEGEF